MWQEGKGPGHESDLESLTILCVCVCVSLPPLFLLSSLDDPAFRDRSPHSSFSLSMDNKHRV